MGGDHTQCCSRLTHPRASNSTLGPTTVPPTPLLNWPTPKMSLKIIICTQMVPGWVVEGLVSLGVSISCLFLGSRVCGAGPCYYHLLCMGSGKKGGLWEPPEQTEQVPRYTGLRPGSLGLAPFPALCPPQLWSQGTKASFQE